MTRARWYKRRRQEERRIKDRNLFKTVEEVFDSITIGHIYRLEAKGVIWELKGVVSSGKEARVYWGKDKSGGDIAVKIYLSATAEFRKSIRKYIEGDPRFESIPKGNFRKLIYEWARKEYRNLVRLGKAGVRVPSPRGLSGNVIVMQFLGEEGYRAPLLVEVISELDKEELHYYYEDLMAQLKTMVCKAGLVHADLSEYNIMIWEGKPWIIDVSQAVLLNHPHAWEFLQRDIDNLTSFFQEHIGRSLRDDIGGVLEQCLKERVEA
ncbi:MAG: serine protein kinase RIO [Desulfurococcales archaeon]|nr:serine protein kinase RIO [Desulfurococcales archaeon]MCE4605677.1 serine protein kinase RIO [Desulfurococcales archaeon]